MIDEEVGLSVPFVEVRTREEAARQLRPESDTRISGVREAFSRNSRARPCCCFWGSTALI
jgi:hypothetical protein